MCAIAGIFDLPWNMEIVESMLKTMKRRGPDECGTFESRSCCLLHSRLSVIDPVGGKQPMTLEMNGETYVLVYNGELYNTEEIRNDLMRLGHHFQGHSDTEVVLHAYAQWAESCLNRFNGIFAFAVWEQHANRIFLVRDRMGVKPLFYSVQNGGLLFSSEMKTILCHPGIKAQIDAEGICEILLLGPGRTPSCGVFRGIHALEPGCCGYFVDGKFVWKYYWKLTDREHTESFDETAAHTRQLVIDAIKRQMVSDVPIGTFLSGGLDSSIISAVCASSCRERGEKLKTFSVDYENNDLNFQPGKFQPTSDTAFIAQMVDYLDTDHHFSMLNTQTLLDNLENATIARDLPGMADVDFSLLAFCGDIRKHVTVALSGECADELFGGYPWFRDPDICPSNGFPWSQNIQERSSFLSPEVLKKINPRDYVGDRYQQTLNKCDVLPGTKRIERKKKQMIYLNMKWFMQTLLDRKDRMSMYNSLEVRVPFCDHRIAEYMYGVPWEFMNYNGREKGLLRHAVGDLLPDEITWRKKSPYPKTYDPQYLQMVQNKLHNILNSKDSAIFQIVDKKTLKNILFTEQAWPWYGQLMRLPQTIAYMIQIEYWLRAYQVEVLV